MEAHRNYIINHKWVYYTLSGTKREKQMQSFLNLFDHKFLKQKKSQVLLFLKTLKKAAFTDS